MQSWQRNKLCLEDIFPFPAVLEDNHPEVSCDVLIPLSIWGRNISVFPSGSISTSVTRPEKLSTLHNHPQDPWRATQYKFAAEGKAHAGPPVLTADQKRWEALNRKDATRKPGMRQHKRPRLWGQVRFLLCLTGERLSLPRGDRTQVKRWHGDRTQRALPVLAGPCEAVGGAGKRLSGLVLPQSLQTETFIRRASGWKAIWKDVAWLIQQENISRDWSIVRKRKRVIHWDSRNPAN